MQKIRSLHLYLGCIFAPMLLFFAISGIWQTLGLQSHTLARLSTIHTSHGLKTGDGLGTHALRLFVLLMAVSFIITTLLGVIMAIRFGRSRRAAYVCLAFGIAFPIALIVWGLVARS
jgi:hypothetical protein